MKWPDWPDFAFAALVIVIGVAPVLSTPGWQGYGSKGDFSCSCGQYNVLFSDSTYGSDRPHIFATHQGSQVDVIQMSDAASTVDGSDIYSSFSMTRQLSGGSLVVDYASSGLNFTKRVSLDNGTVRVDYTFNRNVTAALTFWRWYYTSIGPYDRPVTRSVNDSGTLGFSFFDQGAMFNATVASDPAPTGAQISGVAGAGLNKITLDFRSSSIALTVRVTSVKPLAGAGVLQASSSVDAFPIIGVSVAAVYLAIRTTVTRDRAK